MRLRLELDHDAERALVRDAVRNYRPVGLQAEVLLRQALGLSVPFTINGEQTDTEQEPGPVNG
jgi:hypothetical protein